MSATEQQITNQPMSIVPLYEIKTYTNCHSFGPLCHLRKFQIGKGGAWPSSRPFFRY